MSAKALATLVVLSISLLTSACASPRGPLVLQGTTVIDVRRGVAVPQQTVVVSGERISSIGPASSAAPPPGARVVDAAGTYLIPGLWDAHAHLTYAGSCGLPALVAHGVTGVRDLGGVPQEILKWRQAIREGRLVGPTIRTAGHNVESARWLDAVTRLLESQEDLRHHKPFDSSPRLRVENPEEARAAVTTLRGLGADLLKFRNLGGPSFRAFVEEAKRQNMRVTGHTPAELTLAEAAEAGQHSFEHGETISNRLAKLSPAEQRAQFDRVAAAGTMITPTLIADWVRTLPEDKLREAVENTALHPYVSRSLRAMWQFSYDTRRFNGDQDWTAFLNASAGHLRLAKEAGIQFLVGTDLGVPTIEPGPGVHEEMRLMHERLAMTPAEVLRAATFNAAQWLGMENETGAVAQGLRADLVLLGANPLTDITNSRSIKGVVLGGRWMDSAELDRLRAQTRSSIVRNEECIAGAR